MNSVSGFKFNAQMRCEWYLMRVHTRQELAKLCHYYCSIWPCEAARNPELRVE